MEFLLGQPLLSLAVNEVNEAQQGDDVLDGDQTMESQFSSSLSASTQSKSLYVNGMSRMIRPSLSYRRPTLLKRYVPCNNYCRRDGATPC